MELRRFDSADAFWQRAAPYLARQEAEHNLLLGLAGDLRRQAAPADPPPYLAVAEAADEIAAVALRTPPHRLVLSLAPPDTAEAALDVLAADVWRTYPDLPGVLGPSAEALAFARRWQAASGRAFRRRMALRIFRLDAVTPVTGVPGTLRRATVADRDLIAGWVLGFQRDIGEGTDPDRAAAVADSRLGPAAAPGGDQPVNRGIYVWEHDGHPVSMAGFGGSTPNGIRISLVYTPPEHRRRGYASACVAALSQRLLAAGRRFCFLFTDLANPTPNHIYRAIGYRSVCDVDEYDFVPHP